jgi:hypothetical protein
MDLNAAGGSIVLEGLPDSYRPGANYRFTVTVKHPELRRAGFELAFRVTGAGKQAGVVRSTDARTKISTTANHVQYAHHTAGSVQPVERGLGRWTLEWTAPPDGGAVLLHVAANAADYNDSPLGDRVYTVERKIAVQK